MSDYNTTFKLGYDGTALERGLSRASSALDSTGAKGVAMGNIIANVVGKAFNTMSSAVGGAISRLDTMANYTRIMESLGYAGDLAQESMDRLSGAINGLPTTLDEIVGNTQQLAASMGDLDAATDLAVALNDMFNASGQGADAASRAFIQFNQMIAKGKVDMQSWISVVQTAPAQVASLAHELLGAEANQNDLYQALLAGKVSMDDLNEAIIRLDKEGGEGFASFHDQALSATDGIATGLKNIKSAVTKGVANIIDSFQKVLKANGLPSISKALEGVKGAVNDMFKVAANVVGKITTLLAPVIKTIINNMDAVKAGLEAVVGGMAAMLIVKKVGKAMEALNVAIATATGLYQRFTVGIGQVTAAKAAEAVATDTATVAQKGLNKAMEANPIGMVIGAITALITVLAVLDKVVPRTTKAQQELIDSANELKDSATADYEAYKAAAGEFKETYKEQKKTATSGERLNAVNERMAQVTEDVNTAHKDEFNLLKKRGELVQEYLADEREQALTHSKLKDSIGETEIARRKALSMEKAAIKENMQLQQEASGLHEDITHATVTYEQWRTAAVSIQLQTWSNELKTAVANQTVTLDQLSEANQSTVEKLTTTWQTYYDASTDMFSQLNGEITLTTEQMIANIEHNQQVINTMGDNMAGLRQRVEDMNIEQPVKDGLTAMLDSLADAGPESAGYIAALATASDEELQKLGDLWSGAADDATNGYLKTMDEGAKRQPSR